MRVLRYVTSLILVSVIEGSNRQTNSQFFREDYESARTAPQKLIRHLMNNRGPDIVRPRTNTSQPVNVDFKIELYQIIELNERQQFVSVSAWVIEKWEDDFMYWNPAEFSNITQMKLHHSNVWIPDTTLYNTLVMKDDDQRRLMNVKITTDFENKRSHIEFLYPAIYKFYCRLYLQFFPFDSQTCHMYFGSWTSDNTDIDYFSVKDEVGTSSYMPNEGWSLMGTEGVPNAMGTSNYIPNEEWHLMGTLAIRNEVKYVCCPNNYTILDYTLYLRRRPLFYLVNLVIPTFIITLIAITGFFTTSSTTGVREEKISLCITTLLSMSILMLMVSDQMPSTSTFIPLISWFYICAIVIISVGALAASFVISVQKFGSIGERLPRRAVKVARFFSAISLTRIPSHLQSKDKIKEKLRRTKRAKSGEAAERKNASTISQFAKYIFTAGTEIYGYGSGYPVLSPQFSPQPTPTAYPAVNGTNGLSELMPLKEDSENNAPSSPVKAKKYRNCRLDSVASEITLDDEKLSTRRLARIEYDWLATVIERCTFLVFLTSFLIVSLGINFVGVIHWLNSYPAHPIRPNST